MKIATGNIETSSPPSLPEPITLPFFDPWFVELQQTEVLQVTLLLSSVSNSCIHLKPLEIPDLDFLPLKEEDKKDLAFVCDEYNKLLRNLAAFQQCHEAMVKGAMVYQTAIVDTAQKELHAVKSRVTSVTNSARNHSAATNSKISYHILGTG